MSNTFKITDIPLGSFDVYGNWFPNLNLNMSAADQRRHNMVGGHFKRYKQEDFYGVFVCDAEPTKWQKAKEWISKKIGK